MDQVEQGMQMLLEVHGRRYSFVLQITKELYKYYMSVGWSVIQILAEFDLMF